MQRAFLILVLIAFSVLTGLALWQHGYVGIFEPQTKTLAGLQVFVDLVIALGLFIVWLWRDARAAGRTPWPWIIGTMLTGSIAPLVYLIVFKTGRNA